MKKIAIVLDKMNVGGVEMALIEFLNAIDYSKYEITLYLRDFTGHLSSAINHKVIQKSWSCDSKSEFISSVKSLNLVEITKAIYYRLMVRANKKNWILNFHYSALCFPSFGNEIYDCVIAYQYLNPASVVAAAKKINGKKKVLFVHGKGEMRSRRWKAISERVFEKYERVFCVSNASKEEFKIDFPNCKTEIEVFYNIVSSERILKMASGQHDNLFHNRTNCILTVGRLSAEKGQNMIPRTARLLLDAGYDVFWYLVGDGNLRETIEAEIQKYDVADHVILLGTQMNPYPYIKNCDIYVQTSLSEGWCLTVQEARILQKPIVVTPLPVMHEQIVSGENGLIASDTTPEALAESIKTILDHPELREKFVENLSHETCDNSGELQKLYDFIES